jgi:nucleoside-diphosphate-sugar epimerase
MPTTGDEAERGTGVPPVPGAPGTGRTPVLRKDRRVVVTGGAGLIGRFAIAKLKKRGWDVVVFGRHAVSGFDFRRVDLLGGDSVRGAIEEVRPTHLLHLAWATKHGEFWSTADNLDWTGATCGLIRSFVQSGGSRVVCAGTCAEYDWSFDHMVEDRTPLRPATLYGVCKNATREVVSAFCEASKVSCAWGRVFMPYGDRASGEDVRRLVPSIVTPLLAGMPAVVRSGAHVRDLMPAEDVGRAFADLLESNLSGAVNVASGDPISLGDVARTIGAAVGRSDLVQVEDGPATPSNPLRLTADVTKLRSIGFRPARSSVEGLQELVRQWRSA